MLANHTSIRHLFSKCLGQYEKLRKKQAFLDNYRKFPMFAVSSWKYSVRPIFSFKYFNKEKYNISIQINHLIFLSSNISDLYLKTIFCLIKRPQSLYNPQLKKKNFLTGMKFKDYPLFLNLQSDFWLSPSFHLVFFFILLGQSWKLIWDRGRYCLMTTYEIWKTHPKLVKLLKRKKVKTVPCQTVYHSSAWQTCMGCTQINPTQSD